MTPDRPTRRRFIAIFASMTAGAFAGVAGPVAAADFEWQGVAMGADATIRFNGIEPEVARTAIELVEAEIDRLENALSLYRPDSELCRLNREGMLQSPSGDMWRALRLALSVSAISDGLFDPTVQALWEAYVDWFAARPGAGLPPQSVLATARAAVDWRGISMESGTVRTGAGQRLTLNGLGQGYVTDRIADLLAARGVEHVLVDLGEQRALASRRDGTSWQIARRDAAPIGLYSGALATSEGSGCVLGANGAAHHLFDPRTGRSAARWRRMTVHHRSAAVADALSTALYAASVGEIETMLPRLTGTMVWASDVEGHEWRWQSPPVEGIDL